MKIYSLTNKQASYSIFTYAMIRLIHATLTLVVIEMLVLISVLLMGTDYLSINFNTYSYLLSSILFLDIFIKGMTNSIISV